MPLVCKCQLAACSGGSGGSGHEGPFGWRRPVERVANDGDVCMCWATNALIVRYQSAATEKSPD